jgi:hypothetical protein
VVHVRQGERSCLQPAAVEALGLRRREQVPVLVVDGEQLNDSSFIIKALSAKLEPGRGKGKAGKLTGQAAAEEDEWFRHAQRVLRALLLLLPRWREAC